MKRLCLLILIFICVASVFGLMGCWDAREIDRRAFIFAMGIDLEAGGLYRISAIAINGGSQQSSGGVAVAAASGSAVAAARGDAVAAASASAVVAASASAATTGDTAPKVPVLVAHGRTIAESMEALVSISARIIDLGNLRSIILGETLSRQGVNDVVRAVLADPRTPADVILFQAQGSAEAIIRSEPNGEEHLQAWLDHYRTKSILDTPAQYFVPAWQFRSHLINPGQDAYLGAITLITRPENNASGAGENMSDNDTDTTTSQPQPQPQPTLGGIAVFKGDRLRGFLNEEQTTAFSWMSGKAGGRVVVSSPKAPNQLTTIRVTAMRHELTVSNHKSAAPVLNVKLRVTGAVNSANSLPELASLTAAQVKKQVAATASILQTDFSADLLGFGELARRAAPFDWQPDTWEKQWTKASWNIFVDVSIQTFGRF